MTGNDQKFGKRHGVCVCVCVRKNVSDNLRFSPGGVSSVHMFKELQMRNEILRMATEMCERGVEAK